MVRVLLAFLLLPGIARAGDEDPWPVGTRSVSVSFMAGQTFSSPSDGFSETAVPNLEAGWTVSARLELGIELHPVLWINQPRTPNGTDRQNALAFAGDAILRWYPVPTGRRVAPYAEIALGLCGSPDRIPPSGTPLNFLVQAGAGMAVKTGKRWSTVVGLRWIHLSNGNYGEHNPGVNFAVLLVGGRLSLP
jgi:Lipid A 3-O-deacylase (PagL)